MRIASMGIVLFILLPSLRVLLMLFVFIREGDFHLAAAAGFVLVIIFLSFIFVPWERQTSISQQVGSFGKRFGALGAANSLNMRTGCGM
jgi:hypothetical protein